MNPFRPISRVHLHIHTALIFFFLCCSLPLIQAQNHNIGAGNLNSCSATLFDSGGNGGNYGNNELFTETYCSNIAGQCLTITFNSFDLESGFDDLTIYDGPNTASPLIGTFSGTTSPGTITATGSCLTFVFDSDGSVTRAGWNASISCAACPTCSDGIQNGLEIGVDCGGPTCPPCPCSAFPVTNDESCCATSVPVNPAQACASTTPGTILNATASANADGCGGTPDDDVWFEFVATNTSHYIDLLNVAGSTTDLYHAVYGGTCNSTGAEIICSDPNSSIVSGLTPGNTYYIRVFSWTSTGGQNTTFDVCVTSPPPPPTNDDPCSATTAAVNSDAICTTVTSGYTVGATQSQAGCTGTADDDVWFEFVALSPQQDIELSNATGTTDLVHEVFSGSCGSLTSISCSDPNTSSLSGLTVGDTYYVRVYTYSSSGSNTGFDLCITSPCGLSSSPPDCGLSYSHSTISHSPVNYNTGTALTFSDDRFADSFSNIGFDFCFDGIIYQQCLVSSNGYITFPGCYSTHDGNDADAGGYSPWSINAAAPNNTDAPQNAIMLTWQDIDPSVSGTIRTQTVGTAPNRIFIVKFDDIAMYSSSCNSMLYSAQLMLYETTNVIEFHITEKTTCTTWNSGAAILGLNSFDGTTAVVPAGYNYPDQWSVPSGSSEAHRFTPSCPTCNVVLSSSLTDFSGEVLHQGNQLQWSTTNERDLSHFVVEKSTDAQSFSELDVVQATGNSSSVQNYNMLDPDNTTALAYYRIGLVDIDNQISYSPTIALQRKHTTSTNVNVYPNPAKGGEITLQLKGKAQIKEIRLINSLGQETVVPSSYQSNQQVMLNTSNLLKGTYMLEVQLDDNTTVYKKLTIL